jgi:ELWxxDGT repeat protein
VGDHVFVAVQSQDGWQLWENDALDARRSMIVADLPGDTTWLAAFRGQLYFVVDEGEAGRQIWSSDGTRVGTVRLTGFQPRGAPTAASDLVVAGDTLYFTVDDGVHGRELWRTDSTAAGTRRVADVRAGRAGSDPQWLADGR